MLSTFCDWLENSLADAKMEEITGGESILSLTEIVYAELSERLGM
jgi:hypothetical protein